LIQKHIKRQIISIDGGIQVIADLNAYYNFIASLRVPHLLQEFANLKMLGHVFVVDDAKDLAIIVRDVTRYGGSFRPEVSVVSDFRVCRGALTSRWFTGCLRVCAAPQ
jgi:recyclin-1